MVTGYSFESGIIHDVATLKYSAAGVLSWAVRHGGAAGTEDWPSAIAADGAGNVYVAAFTAPTPTNADFMLLKYAGDGTLAFDVRYDGPSGGWDEPRTLIVNGTEGIYVTGVSVGLDGSYDYATLKYSVAGTLLWQRRYNGPAGDWDEPADLALDAGSGELAVTGISTGADGTFDYATLKYTTAGAIVWEARYTGLATGDDFAAAVQFADLGHVEVTGASAGASAPLDVATLHYDLIGTPVGAPGNTRLPERVRLHPNQPNPFSHATQIGFDLPYDADVQLALFDTQGREIARILDRRLPAGVHRVVFTPRDQRTGIYWARLVVAGADRAEEQVRRVLLVR